MSEPWRWRLLGVVGAPFSVYSQMVRGFSLLGVLAVTGLAILGWRVWWVPSPRRRQESHLRSGYSLAAVQFLLEELFSKSTITSATPFATSHRSEEAWFLPTNVDPDPKGTRRGAFYEPEHNLLLVYLLRLKVPDNNFNDGLQPAPLSFFPR